MEWGIAINLRESVSEITEKSVIADQGGIDTIWLTDFPATRLSSVLASIVARNTENCRIGVGLLSPLIYSPSHITQMMNTLIELYGERFDLLLGPGDRTKLGDIGISYGNISTLVERMSNSVALIRDGLMDHSEIRILMAAQGPKMIEAATCSDGVLLNYSDPEMIQWAISNLKERPQGFTIGAFPPSLIGSSEACEEHMGIKTSAAVVALGVSPSILKQFGLKEELQSAMEKMRVLGMTNDVVEMIHPNILERFSLCGSIESIIDRLEIYQKMGVDMMVYGPPQGASLNGVKRLVDTKNRF